MSGWVFSVGSSKPEESSRSDEWVSFSQTSPRCLFWGYCTSTPATLLFYLLLPKVSFLQRRKLEASICSSNWRDCFFYAGWLRQGFMWHVRWFMGRRQLEGSTREFVLLGWRYSHILLLLSIIIFYFLLWLDILFWSFLMDTWCITYFFLEHTTIGVQRGV